MQAQDPDLFEFGGYKLDVRTRTLSSFGEEIPLRPKCFDVLVILVQDAGQLVSKDQIISSVWPDVVATDESLSRCISDVRAAIGDTTKQIIQTIPGRGYQFSAEVVAVSEPPPPEAPETFARWGMPGSWILGTGVVVLIAIVVGAFLFAIPKDGSRDHTLRASIAVVPFRNSSGDREIEPFVAGLTSDLNSALARIPEMLVISESSTRRYKDMVVTFHVFHCCIFLDFYRGFHTMFS